MRRWLSRIPVNLISILLLSLHFLFLALSVKAGDIFGAEPFAVRASVSNVLAFTLISVAVLMVVWKNFSFPAGQTSTVTLLSIFAFLSLYIPTLNIIGYTYPLLLISAILFTIIGLVASYIPKKTREAQPYAGREKGSSHPKVEAVPYSAIRKSWGDPLILVTITFLVLAEELLINSIHASLGLMLALLALVSLPLSGAIFTRDIRRQRVLEVSALVFANRVVLSPFPMGFLASPSILPTIYTLVLIACILYIAYRKIDLNHLGLTRGKMSILTQVLAGLLIGYGLGFIEYFVLKPTPITTMNLVETLIYIIIVMMVFVGITEELLFRGLLQRSLEDMLTPWQAIGIASLIFALMHIGWLNPIEIVFAYAAGIIFGLTFYKTRSLIAPIVAHGFGNVILYTIVLFL